jgi:hypothetical protein
MKQAKTAEKRKANAIEWPGSKRRGTDGPEPEVSDDKNI